MEKNYNEQPNNSALKDEVEKLKSKYDAEEVERLLKLVDEIEYLKKNDAAAKPQPRRNIEGISFYDGYRGYGFNKKYDRDELAAEADFKSANYNRREDDGPVSRPATAPQQRAAALEKVAPEAVMYENKKAASEDISTEILTTSLSKLDSIKTDLSKEMDYLYEQNTSVYLDLTEQILSINKKMDELMKGQSYPAAEEIRADKAAVRTEYFEGFSEFTFLDNAISHYPVDPVKSVEVILIEAENSKIKAYRLINKGDYERGRYILDGIKLRLKSIEVNNTKVNDEIIRLAEEEKTNLSCEIDDFKDFTEISKLLDGSGLMPDLKLVEGVIYCRKKIFSNNEIIKNDNKISELYVLASKLSDLTSLGASDLEKISDNKKNLQSFNLDCIFDYSKINMAILNTVNFDSTEIKTERVIDNSQVINQIKESADLEKQLAVKEALERAEADKLQALAEAAEKADTLYRYKEEKIKNDLSDKYQDDLKKLEDRIYREAYERATTEFQTMMAGISLSEPAQNSAAQKGEFDNLAIFNNDVNAVSVRYKPAANKLRPAIVNKDGNIDAPPQPLKIKRTKLDLSNPDGLKSEVKGRVNKEIYG